MLSFYHGIFFVNTTQMDITRTPTFSKAALPLGCGCNVKTESPEGKVPSAYPPGLLCICRFFGAYQTVWAYRCK